ncbi:helix-turn-helix domain-containing protein [Streptomyces sp. HC44]|uniref:Helix-turn-helix domain-containing protein n=1 Tax=Streptomyces scabichelini TaxID=2711217 RepID=A0A6G4VKP4_9ACTN|nr:helix-turn-helix domain-containing protein [Streptomyces scabichelini]NGO14364.1 helix-turn-helix domain-containing protein [Streptomyces scabichelini]
MTGNRLVGTFTADVTKPRTARNGFDVFRQEWETQTGQALPLPSFDVGESGDFRINVQAANLHDAVIADVYSERFLGRPAADRESGDRVLVHLMRHGSWRFAALDGRSESVTVPAGSFIARRNNPPSLFDVAPGSRATVLILPTAVLGRTTRGRQIVGSTRSSEMRILMAHASMVRETVRGLTAAGVQGARNALLELARAAVRHEFDDAEPQLAPALARAAMDLADEHLTDPDLSPRWLARQLNVSVRTLHRAFNTAEEPVAAYIRRRRLERARHELLTPWGRPTVAEAAARWHFFDSSHFIRAFKKQYGETPTRMMAAFDEHRRQPPSV